MKTGRDLLIIETGYFLLLALIFTVKDIKHIIVCGPVFLKNRTKNKLQYHLTSLKDEKPFCGPINII